ncbi:MAG TPA: AtpZ/AtpI family protein, partial [bacterium]|nr:AtpZ/AtpI family protein [bacterium]
MKDNRGPLDLQAVKQGATVGAVGLEMGISVVIGYLVGHYLDKWLDTDPVFTIIWIGFGLGAAGMAVYRTYKSAKKAGEEPDAET